MAVTDVREQLREKIISNAVVRSGTPITLSSGVTSDVYVDARRISLAHDTSTLVGIAVSDLIQESDLAPPDVLAAVAIGGIPIACSIQPLHRHYLDVVVVRSEPKKHGMKTVVDGPPILGRNVIVVDDVATSGASIVDAVNTLREHGGKVVGAVALLDRGARETLAWAEIPYYYVYDMDDLHGVLV